MRCGSACGPECGTPASLQAWPTPFADGRRSRHRTVPPASHDCPASAPRPPEVSALRGDRRAWRDREHGARPAPRPTAYGSPPPTWVTNDPASRADDGPDRRSALADGAIRAYGERVAGGERLTGQGGAHPASGLMVRLSGMPSPSRRTRSSRDVDRSTSSRWSTTRTIGREYAGSTEPVAPGTLRRHHAAGGRVPPGRCARAAPPALQAADGVPAAARSRRVHQAQPDGFGSRKNGNIRRMPALRRLDRKAAARRIPEVTRSKQGAPRHIMRRNMPKRSSGSSSWAVHVARNHGLI